MATAIPAASTAQTASTAPASAPLQSAPPVSAAQAQALRDEASAYLQTLLNKNLIVHTTDGRLFRGEFKCTDPECNIVLAHATEYRQPTPQQRAQHAAKAAAEGKTKMTMDMTSRYLGLIVTPGQHVAKIEVEGFLSQMRR